MVIRPGDRVATVIGQDASLIDVFTSLSPAFERLRNPAMRRVMARLVTVEQAARMAGIDAALLVERLNTHLAATGVETPAGAPVETHAASPSPGASATVAASTSAGANATVAASTSPGANATVAVSEPPALARIPAAQRSELDVRAELRAGREPFSLIMAALRERAPEGAFAVRAIFEPVPLYAVMAKQGLAHHTERLANDDWRVWFYPGQGGSAAGGVAAAVAAPDAAALPEAAAAADGTGVVVLDVRDLEPPEPMMRTLAALEQLPAGGTLVQLNVRVPQFLLPLLEERGFTYEVREQEPGLVRVFIRHRPA